MKSFGTERKSIRRKREKSRKVGERRDNPGRESAPPGVQPQTTSNDSPRICIVTVSRSSGCQIQSCRLNRRPGARVAVEMRERARVSSTSASFQAWSCPSERVESLATGVGTRSKDSAGDDGSRGSHDSHAGLWVVSIRTPSVDSDGSMSVRNDQAGRRAREAKRFGQFAFVCCSSPLVSDAPRTLRTHSASTTLRRLCAPPLSYARSCLSLDRSPRSFPSLLVLVERQDGSRRDLDQIQGETVTSNSNADLVADASRQLEAALSPRVLDITNDSSKHRHHAPMRAVGGGDGESHFTVNIVSDKFEGLVSLLFSLSLSPRRAQNSFSLATNNREYYRDIDWSTTR